MRSNGDGFCLVYLAEREASILICVRQEAGRANGRENGFHLVSWGFEPRGSGDILIERTGEELCGSNGRCESSLECNEIEAGKFLIERIVGMSLSEKSRSSRRGFLTERLRGIQLTMVLRRLNRQVCSVLRGDDNGIGAIGGDEDSWGQKERSDGSRVYGGILVDCWGR